MLRRKDMKKTAMWVVLGAAILTLGTFAFGTVDVREKITIVACDGREKDSGYLLALEEVAEAVRSTGNEVSTVRLGVDEPLPAGNIILAGRHKDISAERLADKSVDAWTSPKPEGYRIKPILSPDRKVLLVEGDRRGMMYGLFKLAERIHLGDDLWKIEIESAPAFGLRLFSEEGQLLDIPDIGYYSDSPPYVNEMILRQEVDEEKEMIRHVVGLGYNAFSVLNLGVEEYIDYRYLDKPVYPADDRHRVRSPIFCKYLTELCDYAHSLGVAIYLQVYEIQYPPKLDELYGVNLDGPNIERIINARYKELFERVPLDGMVVTATEVHPRAGYLGKMLWRHKGRVGAGRMMTMYHNACKAAGKKSIFRMWRIADDANSVEEVIRNVPKDAILAVKNTSGDYYLNSPTTTAISGGIGRKQPLVVMFDTFPEFDGWSRLFCYMKRWGKIVRMCRDNGVSGINGWGDWSPGCIWPDYEPGYLTYGDKNKQAPGTDVSWRGSWNSFRMFTRGFTPGQANAYLLSRLAWNPDDDVNNIAKDFAVLHIGRANASAAADALMATEDAFAEEYVDVAHPCYLKWTMVFTPRPEDMEKAYLNNSLDKILASNGRALNKVAAMEQAFAGTSSATAPNAKEYTIFKDGIDKTALYLRTFYLWRQCWWRNRADRDLTGQKKAVNTLAMQTEKAQLKLLFDQWSKYPEEAGFWRVTLRYGQPNLSPNGVFPFWYPRGDTSMEKAAESFGK